MPPTYGRAGVEMGSTWVTKNRPTAAALALGVGLTLFVTLLPSVHLAYENPQLHLALETAEGIIAAHLAYLIVGRFRTTGQLRHLALAWAFAMMGTANLLFGALPIVTLGSRPAGIVTWAAAGLRLVAIAMLCLAGFAGTRLAPQGRAIVVFVASTTLGVLATVGLLAAAADAFLARPVDPSIAPTSSGWAGIVGHPVVLGVQLVALLLFAIAAVKFTREAQRTPDHLLRWLGAGAVLGAFARLNYFLFPSLYSNWVYTGDLLRLGSYLFFVVGAAREIDAYWRDHATLAVFEERRRVARELHDGLAQELAFIRSQTAAMAAGMPLQDMVGHVATAAERALEESRRAIATLADHGPAPLREALRVAAEEVAAREGTQVDIDVDTMSMAPAVTEALVRVVREAVGNAARHGAAQQVRVRMACDDLTLRLEVVDDGQGFVPGEVHRGFGLTSMRERVEALGGELRIRSVVGAGTTVEAMVPTSPFAGSAVRRWRRTAEATTGR
ncbi:MAG TPA: sensor histidine kinase [Acidimicrobiales bacterium]|nr:sensor histidine kinase [Acidimicrobiales bacterium]